jgi:outer membrane protein TolC
MIKKEAIMLTLFSLLINFVFAQQTQKDSVQSFSLKQAQDYALQNSPLVKNANLDLESAKKKIWETTAIGLPQVNSKLAYSYMLTLSSTMEQLSSFSSIGNTFSSMYGMLGSLAVTAGDNHVLHMLDSIQNANAGSQSSSSTTSTKDLRWGLTYDVTVSQLLFSGSYLVGLQTTKVYKQLSESAVIKSQLDVSEQVTNAYYLVLIAQENKSLLDTTYANTSKILDYIKSTNAQGLIEETDVDQMQLTVSTLKNAAEMITRQLEVAKNLLKFQMGIELSQKLILTDDLNSLLASSDLAVLSTKDFKVESNVDYGLMETYEKLSALNLKLQKSTLLPDVAAFYQHEENFNKNSFSFTPPNLIGVSMNIPIFGSGMKIAKIQQAKIALEKAKNSKEQVSLGLQTTFSSAQSTFITDVNTYLTKKQNVILAQKIYNKNIIKYKEGIIGSLELTLAQNQYLQAQTDYYTSIIDLSAAKSKLEKLLK